MRILGGSFGVKGSAYLSQDVLVVEGAAKAQYRAEQIKSVTARIDSDKRFGLVGAALGVVLLGGLGLHFFGLLGAIVGVAVSIAGSFYTTKKNIAEVVFADGKTLSLECTARAMSKLVQFYDQ